MPKKWKTLRCTICGKRVQMGSFVYTDHHHKTVVHKKCTWRSTK